MKTVMETADLQIGQTVKDGLNQTLVVCESNWKALERVAQHGNLRLLEGPTGQSLREAVLQDLVEYWRSRAYEAEDAASGADDA